MNQKKAVLVLILVSFIPFSVSSGERIDENLPIGMNFKSANALHVFNIISTVSNIHFILDETLADRRIDITIYDSTVGEAIKRICYENGFAHMEGPYHTWVFPSDEADTMEREFERAWMNYKCLSRQYHLTPLTFAVRGVFDEMKPNVSCPRFDSAERPAVSPHFYDILLADIDKCLTRIESLPDRNSPLRTSYLRELRRRIAMADDFQVSLAPEVEAYRD